MIRLANRHVTIARKALVAVVAVVLAAAGCEIVLAVLPTSFLPPPLYPGDVAPATDATADPLVGWKLQPSAVITETTDDFSVSYTSNALGFRSHGALVPSPTDRPLVFLGDSYTFGSGVADDETFAALLEQAIGTTPCVNLGMGGFGLDQMWMTLRHYGLPLRPRAVVLSFIRHDLDRSLSAYRLGHIWREKPTFCLVDGQLVPQTVANRPSAARRFVAHHSRIAAVWRRAEQFLTRRFAVGPTWRLNRAIFEAIRDDCRRAGVPLLVVHIPVNRRSPAPGFKSSLSALGIPYLDLGDHLPADADALYYPRDRHLNPAGHRFVADQLRRFLVAEGVIAQAPP